MTASSTLKFAIDKAAPMAGIIAVLVGILHPTFARAAYSSQTLGQTALVFEVKTVTQNSENTDQIQPSLAYETIISNDVNYQTQIAYANLLREYLQKRNSPLANCADLLVSLGSNGDKILSLANAESGLGAHYIQANNNLWGVGGGSWKMGSNVCEGVQSMDNFLNAYPRKSPVKYRDMPLEQMNGLYKQPAAAHWLNNNYAILKQLQTLKTQAAQIAQNKISPPVIAATADIELANK